MSPRIFISFVSFVAMVSAMAGSSPSSSAMVEVALPESTTDWHARMALYAWTPALDGDLGVKYRSASAAVGIDEVLSHLDWAIMAVMEIGVGDWSVLADVNDCELSASESLRAGDVDLTVNQFIGNFALYYAAMHTQTTSLSLSAGVRVNSMDVGLDLTRRHASFSGSQRATWVDPIVGFRFQRELTNAYFVRGLGDIGGFGVASDLTWQAFLGIGYRATENGSIVLGYRAISSDYSDGGFSYDVISHGPVLGYEYRF